MEDQAAFLKLFRKSVEVSVPRRKYELEKLREELARVKEALGSGAKPRRLFKSWFKGILGPAALAGPLASKAASMEAAIIVAERDTLEGRLFPLTVLEMAEAKQAYYVTLRYLTSRIREKVLDAKQRKVEDEGAELMANEAFKNKVVELALKKDNGKGQWFPFLSEEEVTKLHPLLVGELYEIHVKAFQLTESEVKK